LGLLDVFLGCCLSAQQAVDGMLLGSLPLVWLGTPLLGCCTSAQQALDGICSLAAQQALHGMLLSSLRSIGYSWAIVTPAQQALHGMLLSRLPLVLLIMLPASCL